MDAQIAEITTTADTTIKMRRLISSALDMITVVFSFSRNSGCLMYIASISGDVVSAVFVEYLTPCKTPPTAE